MKEPLKFTKIPNGYYCEYFGNDKMLHGIGALSHESLKLAEMNMWEMLREIKKRHLSLDPSITLFSPRDKHPKEPVLIKSI